MKIEQFLKGSTMICRFNEAQLSRPQRESLKKVCDVLQLENELELEVTVVEFPIKLKVTLDNEITMLLGWSYEDNSYSGLTTPEIQDPPPDPLPFVPLPESEKDTVDLPGPVEDEQESKPDVCLDMAGKIIPGTDSRGSELDLAPVLERSDALANAFVKLAKPLNNDQRQEIWIRFNAILFKELLG